MIKVAEILEAPEKWCQGEALNGERRYLTRAIYEAYILRAEAAVSSIEGEFRFLNILGSLASVPVDLGLALTPGLMAFNDAPGRTFAEVHAVACEIDRLRMLRGEA